MGPMGPMGQAVVDGLLARVTELEHCEHDQHGFAYWIATRPDWLLCGFCYEAAQVMTDSVRCAACGQNAWNPDQGPVVMHKVSNWLGAHFYLCKSCADLDLHIGGRRC